MKVLLLTLLFASLVFGQVKMDSSYVEYMGNAVYELHGYATFQQPVIVSDYDIGFRFSEYEYENTYVPMGYYELTTGNRVIHFWTEIVNPPFASKFFFSPSIIPRAEVKKFAVTDVMGVLTNIYAEPIIDGDLPYTTNVGVGENALFTIFATGEDLEYEWFVSTMNTDSTEKYNYDSLGVVVDTFYVYTYTWNEATKINGETSSTYITNKVKLDWNGSHYYVRVYNYLGEDYSVHSYLRVR